MDLVGKIFGKLTVVKKTAKRRGRDTLWECVCKCGDAVYATKGDLNHGGKKSCGKAECKYLNLIGRTFGRLTVVERIAGDHLNAVRWKCRCNCGNENYSFVPTHNLLAERTQSCGCLNKEAISQPRLKLDGQRFGQLVVLKYAQNGKWLCRCECGNETKVYTANLTSGHTKS